MRKMMWNGSGRLPQLLALGFLTLNAPQISAQEAEEEELVEDTGDDSIGNEDSEFHSGIRIANVNYAGTGCPDGTASFALSPDNKALSLLFDAFQVIAGGENAARASKQCRVKVSFEVPAGFVAMVVRTDIRGFQSLPRNAQSTVVAGYGNNNLLLQPVPGRARPISARALNAQKTFVGPVEKDFAVKAKFHKLLQWTKCGSPFTMDLNLKVTTTSNARKEEALSSIDTLDGAVQDAFLYHIRWKRCQGNKPPPTALPPRVGRGRPLPAPAPGRNSAARAQAIRDALRGRGGR